MQATAAQSSSTASQQRSTSDLIPENWEGSNEKGEFINFMTALHLWNPVPVESADKIDNECLSVDCSEMEFRDIETALQ